MKKIKTILLFVFIALSNPSYAETIKPIIDGNSNAKIKLVVYESLTCGHCAKFHNEVFLNSDGERLAPEILMIDVMVFLQILVFRSSCV